MDELAPGSNCWRIERAGRARVIVDAADYFACIREAMLLAKERIFLIGWDFDTRIKLLRTRRKKGDPPVELGAFILWLADTRPDLEILILNWDMGALKLVGRGRSLFTAARWAMHPRIHFKLDSAHPPGCSHHQKIVAIDDSLAVCGGIDMTADRWDNRSHDDDDRGRKRPNGKPYPPWHDATMMLDGPCASALAELGRARWERAGGDPIVPCAVAAPLWPAALEPHFDNVEIAIARTVAAYDGAPEISEIETLYLEQIAAAKHFIYAENQYFASRKIAEAIAKRLAEPDPPEIVLVTALSADGWLEQLAMDSARARLVRAIGEKDANKRFHIFTPQTAGGTPIYVHAKLMIIDDRLLRIGSANWNNRSLGLDSECDVVIDCDREANADACAAIRALRIDLLAEHLGRTPQDIETALDRNPSMAALIEASRRPAARTLERLVLPELGEGEAFVADNVLLDPERPEDFFEPIAKRGLFSRRGVLRKPAKAA